MRVSSGGLAVLALLACRVGTAWGTETSAAELMKRVRASKVDGLPAIQGVVVTPELPDGGHNTPHHQSQYNIWSLNCHTQANNFVARAGASGVPAGILACDGNPEQSAQYHTANWAVMKEGLTCVYNWGSSCCWTAVASPPDIASGKGNHCARWACGDQYKADMTRAMEAGKLVESPGPHVCAVEAAGGPATLLPGMAVTALTERVRTNAETVNVPAYPHHPEGAVLTFTPERLDACLTCCKDRADLWSGNAAASVTSSLATGREDTFRRQCSSACRYAFSTPENRQPPSGRAGR